MKTLITIMILTLIVSCNKNNSTTPSNVSSNSNNTIVTPCSQYGACSELIYTFDTRPLSTPTNDTILRTGSKIKYTFVGYEYVPGNPWRDTLKYKLTYVNVELSTFTFFTNYIYRSYGYKERTVMLSTKGNKNMFFSSDF